MKPGSAELVLAVDDVDAARQDLIARGAKVSEVFHYAAGPFNNSIENPRVSGRDPEGRSYFTFACLRPDGNRGCCRNKERLPAANGRMHKPWTSPRLQSSFARRRSITAATKHARQA